jgi:CheY-like chemotaxis protein
VLASGEDASSEDLKSVEGAIQSTWQMAGPEALVSRNHLQSREPGLRILLADDNIVNQKVAGRMLQKEGHTITVVDSGFAVLEALERQAFDLVLMDVQMPGMDGVEATISIRRNEKISGNHIPIIALTAHAMSQDRDRCLIAGMDAYVTKPIRPETLKDEIRRVRASIFPIAS